MDPMINPFKSKRPVVRRTAQAIFLLICASQPVLFTWLCGQEIPHHRSFELVMMIIAIGVFGIAGLNWMGILEDDWL
jgi:hypothetical protein